MSLPVCGINDLDVRTEIGHEESDDLGAAQGIALAVVLSLPVWAVSVWLAYSMLAF
ncbi:MAG TPA: hypothetical protein VFU41_14005 [Gemmatimonadales bacterium]|nr:hypothetical protein [Gemmatimonadales bacterium]